MNTLKHQQLTNQIIRAFYRAYNGLGYGFLERVYENALVLELHAAGIQVAQQQPVKVYYRGTLVGDYYADLIINDAVIVELKAADVISVAHEAQLLNYLKATNIEVGLLLNFGPKPTFKRKILTNEKKNLNP